jgi:hypothetical protein
VTSSPGVTSSILLLIMSSNTRCLILSNTISSCFTLSFFFAFFHVFYFYFFPIKE